MSDYDDYDLIVEDFDVEDKAERKQQPKTSTVKSTKEKKKKRGSGLRTALIVSGIFLILLLLLYVGSVLYQRLAESQLSLSQVSSKEDPELLPMYSQDELDEQIARVESNHAQVVQSALEEGNSQGAAAVLDRIRESLSGGNTVMETLRGLYPDEVVVASEGRYHFIPINRSLAQSTVTQENLLVQDSGEFVYTENGAVVSHKGIDVSSHQGSINWGKVADDGVEFAIIRAMYRGYGSGKLVEDDYFDKNMKGAIDNGIHVGAYVFTQAVNREEMLEEAEKTIKMVSKYASNVPIVIDVERVSGKSPRMDELSVEERTDLVLLFCDTVRDAGFTPMIYYNTEMSILFLDLERLENIPKWYASYSENIFYPYAYDIWQYTSGGSVRGIKGDVDLDISFNAFWE